MGVYCPKVILKFLITSIILVTATAKPTPNSFWDFGKMLSDNINMAVNEGLKNLPDFSNFGTAISQSVSAHIENAMWYKGANVCSTEEVEELSDPFPFYGYSSACSETNGEFICIITENKGDKTQRTIKKYKCCDNYSLQYDGDKLICKETK
uniref:14.3 kDa salivary protein n=1 Tax=Phlebotomus sergenti TaxID=85759 RepID=F6K8S9_9DIPT